MNNALSIEGFHYTQPLSSVGADVDAIDVPATPPALFQSGRNSDFGSKLRAWALANAAGLINIPRSEPTKPFRVSLMLVGDKTGGVNVREDIYLVNNYAFITSLTESGAVPFGTNGSILHKIGTHYSVLGSVAVTGGRTFSSNAHYFGETSTFVSTGLGAAMGLEPVAFPSVSNGTPSVLNLRDVGPFTHILRVFGTGDVGNANKAASCTGLHLRWS